MLFNKTMKKVEKVEKIFFFLYTYFQNCKYNHGLPQSDAETLTQGAFVTGPAQIIS